VHQRDRRRDRIAACGRLIEQNPQDAAARYDRGFAYVDEAIRLDPDDADPDNGRGNVGMHKQDYDRAIADCDEAIRLNPKFDDVRDDVLEATRNRQQPFIYGRLPGKRDFFFVAGR
jgi:tetratricopeptide (TPR) repeat protein